MEIKTKNNLSQKQRDRIIKNSSTINMTWEQTQKERIINRKIKRKIKKLPQVAKWLAIIWFIFIILWLLEIKYNKELDEAKEELLNTWSITIINKAEAKEEEKYIEDYTELEEKAFNFIIQYEWYRDKPYWDFKQWSCWYWMRCNKDTTWITKEKSKWYVIQRIRHIQERFDLYNYNEWLQVALISFAYNTWTLPLWYDWYIKNNYLNALKNKMKLYVYAWWKKLKWLEKRRQDETNLF